MKRLGYILILAVATLFASCEDMPEQPNDTMFLSVEMTSKSLESTNGSFKVAVESNTRGITSKQANRKRTVFMSIPPYNLVLL